MCWTCWAPLTQNAFLAPKTGLPGTNDGLRPVGDLQFAKSFGKFVPVGLGQVRVEGGKDVTISEGDALRGNIEKTPYAGGLFVSWALASLLAIDR
jgi:hypothetical protein